MNETALDISETGPMVDFNISMDDLLSYIALSKPGVAYYIKSKTGQRGPTETKARFGYRTPVPCISLQAT